MHKLSGRSIQYKNYWSKIKIVLEMLSPLSSMGLIVVFPSVTSVTSVKSVTPSALPIIRYIRWPIRCQKLAIAYISKILHFNNVSRLRGSRRCGARSQLFQNIAIRIYGERAIGAIASRNRAVRAVCPPWAGLRTKGPYELLVLSRLSSAIK